MGMIVLRITFIFSSTEYGFCAESKLKQLDDRYSSFFDKQDNVNYRMHNTLKKIAVYSIYYDGVESTAQYS